MSNQRIAHILPWTSIGGTEHGTLRIADAARTCNFDSVMFCLPNSNELQAMMKDNGYETVQYNAPDPSLRRGAKFLAATVSLAVSLRQQNVKIVHCTDVLAAYQSGCAARFAGARLVSHVRSRHDGLSPRERRMLRLVEQWIFVSHDTWRHFAVNVPPTRGRVIYDGIDYEKDRLQLCHAKREARQSVRHEFGIAEDEKIVGMVARVSAQKDFATLAGAAREIVKSNPRTRFMIVGDYEQAPSHREHFSVVQEILKDNQVAEHFVFTGFRNDVTRLVRAMDAFVLCTHIEGLPLVLLEGMAQGIPTLATAIDGVPELITDEANGLLHKHQDKEKLAYDLSRVLTDENLARRLGEEAYNHIVGNFSCERFSRYICHLYQSATTTLKR